MANYFDKFDDAPIAENYFDKFDAKAPAPAAASAGYSTMDTIKAAAQGAVGATKSMFAGFGADNAPAEYLEGISKSIGASMSPERRAEQQRRLALEKEAAVSGSAMKEITTGLGGVTEAPIQAVAQGVGSSIPTTALGLAAAALTVPVAAAFGVTLGAPVAIAAAVGLGTKYLLGALQGAGEVKGSIYDAVYRGLKDKGVSEPEAKAQALKSQEYIGDNWGTISAAAGIGGVAGGTGVEKQLTKLFTKPAVSEAVKQTAEKVVEKGVLRKVATEFGKEALPEGAQAGQGKYAENVAMTRAGMETPAMQGVLGATARDALVGGLTGAAVSTASKGEDMAPEVFPVEEAKAAEAAAAAKVRPPTAERPSDELAAEVARISQLADTKSATREELASLKAMRKELKARKAAEVAPVAEVAPEVAPVAEVAPEVAPVTEVAPNAITASEVKQFGTMSKANRTWMEKNVTGKTPEQVRDMVAADPTILTKKPGVAAALKEIINAVPALPTDIAQAEPIRSGAIVPAPAEPIEQPTSRAPEIAPAAGVVPPAADVSLPTAGEAAVPTPVVAEELPAPPPVVAEELPAPPPVVAEELPAPPPAGPTAPQDAQEAIRALTALMQDPRTSPAKKRAAVQQISLLNDKSLNTTDEDIAANLGLAAKTLGFEVKAGVVGQKVAPEIVAPRIPQGMFGSLVKEGAPDLVEEAPAPIPTEASGRFDWGSLDTKEDRAARAHAKRQTKKALAPAPAKTAVVEQSDATRTVESMPEAMAIVQELEGKSIIEAADWAAENLPSPDQRLIAQRVSDTLRELQTAGAGMGAVAVTKEGYRLSSGAVGLTEYTFAQEGAKSNIAITLNHPSNIGQSGINAETILHELIHAATMGSIRAGKLKSAEGTKLAATVAALYDVSNAVMRHFNARVNSGVELTAFETAYYKRENNALRNADEVLVWAMSNPDMQAYMESIPYKGATLWDKFTTLIRDMLGLTPKADTALSELLRVGGELTSMKSEDLQAASRATGRQLAVSPGSEAITEAMNARAPDNSMKRPTSAEVRTMVVDSMASVIDRLNKQFKGAIRGTAGQLNPAALMRQAADTGKFLTSFVMQGGFRKNPVTGTYEVFSDPAIKPPAEIFNIIDRMAKAAGMNPTKMQNHVSVILEGVRLHHLEIEYAKAGQLADFRPHMTKAQVATQMASYNATPEIQEISKLMDDVRIKLVDHMERVGRITPDMAKDWKAVIGYVPFDRLKDVATRFDKIKKPSGRGIGQFGSLPELVGSGTRAVGNVFENYIGTLGWMMRQITTTDAVRSTLEVLAGMGEAKLTPGNNIQKSKTGITQHVYVNGVKTYYDLQTKYDKHAFADEAPPPMAMVRIASKLSNILRLSVTALPPFALKQVVEDVGRAVFFSGVKNPASLIAPALVDFARIAIAEFRGQIHPIVRKMAAKGLVGEVDFNPNETGEFVMKQMGLKERSLLGSLMHKLEGVTRASDLAVRNAVYEQTRKETQSAQMQGGDILLAETRARELINFRRKGASASVGFFISTVPFFNAYLQGTDLIYRNAMGTDSSMGLSKSEAQKQFAIRAAMVFGFSLMYAISKSDDDDYKKMDLRTRSSNWIVGDGIKIPVAGELAALFKVPAEALVEHYKRSGTKEEQTAKEAVGTVLSYAFEQYVGRVSPMPQAVKPLAEALFNYSFMTGRSLEGQHQQTLDAHLRKSGSTSGLATVITEFLSAELKIELSPIKVDAILDGYLGSASALTKMLTDGALNPNKPGRPLEKWMLLSNYMYETGDSAGTRPMDEFYKLNEQTSMAANTMNKLAQTDVNAAIKYGQEHANEIALNRTVQHTLMDLAKLREAKNVLSSPNGAKIEPDKAKRDAMIKAYVAIELKQVTWVREIKHMLKL